MAPDAEANPRPSSPRASLPHSLRAGRRDSGRLHDRRPGSPYLSKIAIDDGIDAGNLRTLSLVVVAFLAAGVAAFALSGAQTYLTGWVGERALADLRIQLFGHLQRLSLGYYERNRTGAIVTASPTTSRRSISS